MRRRKGACREARGPPMHRQRWRNQRPWGLSWCTSPSPCTKSFLTPSLPLSLSPSLPSSLPLSLSVLGLRGSALAYQSVSVVEVVPPQGAQLSWPPTSHTVNCTFLYCTFSTLNPARSHTHGSPTLSLFSLGPEQSLPSQSLKVGCITPRGAPPLGASSPLASRRVSPLRQQPQRDHVSAESCCYSVETKDS